jgi:hypothetical protein
MYVQFSDNHITFSSFMCVNLSEVLSVFIEETSVLLYNPFLLIPTLHRIV